MLIGLFIWPFTVALGQTGVHTYGRDNVNEGGHVLCEDRNNGFIFIGGHRQDSTLILKVDYNGNLIDEVTFKFAPNGRFDFLADLKFDDSGNFLIGCGTLPNNGAQREGYAFQLNPNTLALNWSRIFTGGNTKFAPVSIHDIGSVSTEYFLTGTSYGLEDVSIVALDKATGVPVVGSMNHYNLQNSESFFSSVFDGNRFRGTGRFGHSSQVTDYRPGLMHIDPTTFVESVENTFMVGVSPGDQARLYSYDLILTPDTTLVVGEGDFTGGTFAVTNAFMTINEPNKNIQEDGFVINVTNFVREGIHEALLVPGSSPATYIMLGQGRRPANQENDDQLWLMSIDRFGQMNWGMQYGGSEDDFLTNNPEAQQQLIPVNAGAAAYAFTATTKSYGQGGSPNLNEDILLVLVDAQGQIQQGMENCIESPIQATMTQQSINNFPDLTRATTMAQHNGNTPQQGNPALLAERLCGSCWAALDTNYIQITNPITFDASNMQAGVLSASGKYFVGANVTVDGIVLDLTGVDLVFAPCTRITFINGARLRANNSTFRPCDENASWDGLYFTSTGTQHASGVVNECVFKNAVNAFSFAATTNPQQIATYDVRLTNNLFVNCLTGVSMPGVNPVQFQEGITGNSFTVDRRPIAWTVGDGEGGCTLVNTATGFFGINASTTKFGAQISQNDFINTSDTGATRLTGVLLATQSTGRVTLNNFTNNYHAIQVNGCLKVSIENNRIELTQLFPDYQTQILVGRGSHIWITGNHLANSTEFADTGLTGAAISLQSCRIINVKENIVDGFNHGIQLLRASRATVNENRITNCNHVGIYLENAINDTISCNEIKMRLRPNPLPQSVGILLRHGTPQAPTIDIKGNCITDTDVAIWAEKFTGPVVAMPRIHNNYLYNYRMAGVYTFNFNGSQGTGILTPSQAGRNTFVSNNILGGAIDVVANQPQTWYGNAGINTVSSGVTLVGNGVYPSIASCGRQIGAGNSTIDNGEICDGFMSNYDGSYQRAMAGDFSDFIGAADRADLAIAILQDLAARGEDGAAQAMIDWMEVAPNITQLDKARARYALASQRLDWEALPTAAQDLAILDATYGELAAIEAVRTTLANSGRSFGQMTDSEQDVLMTIDQQRAEFSADARAVLHAGTGRYPHILYPITLPESFVDGRKHEVATQSLQLIPNPAHNQVTLQYAVENAVGASLHVYDATGRRVLMSMVAGDASTMVLDLQGFAPGIYMVTLIDGLGQTTSQKLLVQ